ncbi:MAG: hypothetical protein AAF567_19250 [Actinomycetota bacterium]
MIVRIGPLRIALDSDNAEAARRLDVLFGAFPVADPDDEIDVVVRIETEQRGDDVGFLGMIDGATVRWSTDLALVEEAITRRVNRAVLDAEDDRLHLHGGAVERDGRVVLVTGPSGSGKSTLVAALVRAGWRALSDEQLGVLPGGRLVPYPRPITLRRGSWELFDHAVTDSGSRSPEVGRVEVAIHELGQVYEGPPVAPDIIIRPVIDEAEPSVEPLRQAASLSLLLVDTLDLERAGSAGIAALISLVEAAPAFRITGTSLEQTIKSINGLAEAASPPGPVTSVTTVVDDDGERTPGAIAWRFADGSAAVHDPDGGALAILDGDGLDAWELLGHGRANWPSGLAESEFVTELRSVGLLCPDGESGP